MSVIFESFENSRWKVVVGVTTFAYAYIIRYILLVACGIPVYVSAYKFILHIYIYIYMAILTYDY